MDTLKVDVWEERDRLHICLHFGEQTIAEWRDDDARQMFEDGFFKPGRELEASVIDYARGMKLLTHFVYGSGMHSCLYDNGPFLAWRLKDAVEDLAQTFELGRTRRARLAHDSYLELGRDFGADYCEITECDCTRPEEHDSSE